MASITELAKELNLSIGTVSRILNDDKAPYAPHTRRRVLARADEIGYRPHPVARALARKRTDAVALWIGHLRSAYNGSVISALTSQSAAQEYNLLVRLFENGAGPSSRGGASFIPDSVDGIIVHGVPPTEWISQIQNGRKSVPIVVMGHAQVSEIPDYVEVSIYNAARQAVEHLVEGGRRRIAFLTLTDFVDARYEAYVAVMQAAGLPLEIIAIPPGSRAEASLRFRDYVAAHKHPEAVFCYNDDTAIAVSKVLFADGLSVPDDVALVGCDGIEDADFLPVPLSTIRLPVDEMARLAWDFLKNRMANPDAPPQRAVLEATFEARSSTQK